MRLVYALSAILLPFSAVASHTPPASEDGPGEAGGALGFHLAVRNNTGLTHVPPALQAARLLGEEAANAPSVGFEEIYELHFDFVWRFVGHRGVPEAARDDVVQEIFLTVHRRLHSFEGQSSLRTWIGGIARLVARDYVRKKRHQPAAEFQLDESHFSSTEALPPDALERKDARLVLTEILARLPEAQREAFLAIELDQLSGQEAAELLGINENTLRTRLRAAREAFNGHVARHLARINWRERD